MPPRIAFLPSNTANLLQKKKNIQKFKESVIHVVHKKKEWKTYFWKEQIWKVLIKCIYNCRQCKNRNRCNWPDTKKKAMRWVRNCDWVAMEKLALDFNDLDLVKSRNEFAACASTQRLEKWYQTNGEGERKSEQKIQPPIKMWIVKSFGWRKRRPKIQRKRNLITFKLITKKNSAAVVAAYTRREKSLLIFKNRTMWRKITKKKAEWGSFEQTTILGFIQWHKNIM